MKTTPITYRLVQNEYIKPINQERKNLLVYLYYLLLVLNIGVGNIMPGYFYMYLPIKYITSFAAIFTLFSGLIYCWENRFYIDRVLLILQVFFFAVAIYSWLMNSPTFQSTTFLALIGASILAYLLSSILAQKIDGLRFLNKFIAVYAVWLSFQTIAISGQLFLQMGIISKDLIQISIGGSNYIAAHLIFCLIYLLFSGRTYLGKWYPWIISTVLAAIFFTISFGAIASFGIVLVFVFLARFKSLNNVYKILLLLTLVVMLFLGIQVITGWALDWISEDNPFYSTVYKFWLKFQAILQGDKTKALASRDVLYQLSIEKIAEKPLFGHNNYYVFFRDSDFRSHNWILDILLLYGFAGGSIYIILVCYVLFRIHKIAKFNQKIAPIKYALWVALIHGLLEPNFFAREFDFLWWMFVGFAIGTNIKNEFIKKDNGKVV